MILKKLLRKQERNIGTLHKSPEIKGNKTDKYVIKKVLQKINNEFVQ